MKALALAGLAAVALSGCMYRGLTVSKDGTTYVAKNDMLLFGLMNKIFICTPNGTALTCKPSATIP